MKKTRLTGLLQGVLVSLGATIGNSAWAQIASYPTYTNIAIPVVTVRAPDPVGTWGGNPAVFTVFRTGSPAPPLHVWYDIGGTAINGVDYQAISHWVDIPSGVLCSDIVIYPTNMMANPVSTSKTVILTLTNSPLLGPGGPLMPVNYSIGSPSSATATVYPGPDTNNPPLVRMASPPDGAVFWTPVNIPLFACGRDVDGFVRTVEFFADNVSLGIVSNPIAVLPPLSTALPALPPMPPYRPFILAWSNAPAGTHTLTATATDDGGASSTSDPVKIRVNVGPPPPPTNLPPLVRITSPANGAAFHQPVNLPVFAFAWDRDGGVTNVEFFAGTNDIGAGQRVYAVPPVLPPGPIQPPILIVAPTNYWSIVWSNAPLGDYPLTAVATDNRGASRMSDPVNVAILLALPPLPPTNLVAVFAIEPIAIEGTNCWPWLGLAAAAPTWSNWTAPAAIWRYFTNCGPKDAVFTVRRLGQTNSDLTVTYAIGGTATNGLDYVTLPGTVSIPAGDREAMITVVPLDDGTPDLTSTVVLKLTPSTNYWVDPRHSMAAALILDSQQPPPASAGLLRDGSFRLSATGPEGAYVRFEYSPDLLTWTPLCTNQLFYGLSDVVDPNAASNPSGFYRAVQDADPPR